MADATMPDLSHLTEDERQIIEQVLQRQRAEESQEMQLRRKYEKQLEEIEKQIEERKEVARKLVGTMDDAICQICQKTKFADGIGHKCYYCQLRSCARCGGRLNIKTDQTKSGTLPPKPSTGQSIQQKTIWSCSLCQQRQQILAKTGKWFHHADNSNKTTQSTNESPSAEPDQSTSSTALTVPQKNLVEPRQVKATPVDQNSTSQKIPELQPQAIFEPTAKNNIAHADSSSSPDVLANSKSLKRQSTIEDRCDATKTDEDRLNQRSISKMSTSSEGSPSLYPQTETSLIQSKLAVKEGSVTVSEPAESYGKSNHQQQSNRLTIQNVVNRDQKVSHSEDDAIVQQSQLKTKTTERVACKSSEQVAKKSYGNADNLTHRESLTEQKGELSKSERSSSSNWQLAYTDTHAEDSSKYGNTSAIKNTKQISLAGIKQSNVYPSSSKSTELRKSESVRSASGTSHGHRIQKHRIQQQTDRQTVDDQATEWHEHKSISIRRALSEIGDYNLSTTSDQFFNQDPISDCLSRAARDSIQTTKRQGSLSSSDEDFPSTSECQSYEDLESESYSERGRQTKTKQRHHMFLLPEASNQQFPLKWQSSPDGTFIYRKVTLHRTAGTSLGLKVTGGRSTSSGRLGAFITKVKRGSVADTVGHLVPGDEVFQWNGSLLANASFDEVCEVINQSKFCNRIELVIARTIMQTPFMDEDNYAASKEVPKHFFEQRQLPYRSQTFGTFPSQALNLQAASGTLLPDNQTPIVMITAPLVDMLQLNSNQQQQNRTISGYSTARISGQIFGQINVSLLYVPDITQLIVTVIEAVDLPPRSDGSARNPYVKMFLLPDRSEKSRRQSKTMAETCNPMWRQSLVYKEVTFTDLNRKAIEITVWDYDQYASNDFLGEVLIDLSKANLDNTPFWYTLIDMDEEASLKKKLRHVRPTSASYSKGLPARYDHSHRDLRLSAHSNATLPTITSRNVRQKYHDETWATACSSGYRSDSGVAFGSQEPRHRLSLSHHKPYDNAEATHWEEADPSTSHISGYYSDYTSHRRSRSGRRYAKNVQSVFPLELRPNSPTEESGNETSSPSHVISGSLRRLPHPPPSLTDGCDHKIEHKYSSKKSSSDQVEDRANIVTGDYLSDGSETSISMPSTRSERLIGSQMIVKNITRERSLDEEHMPRSSPPVNNNSSSHHYSTHVKQDSAEAGGYYETTTESNYKTCNATVEQIPTTDKRKKSLMTRLIPGRVTAAQLVQEQKRVVFRRSDEVGVPVNLSPQTSLDITKQSSRESTDSNESSLVPVAHEPGSIGEFVDGLGPGQVVGRQAVASPCLGEIQISLYERRSNLEVRIIRARHLNRKPGSKFYPSPYVKVYLCDEKSVVAKAKTGLAARTPEPRFDQLLIFTEAYHNRLLQVILVGDYGRIERKSVIGLAMIRLSNLDLTKPIEAFASTFFLQSSVFIFLIITMQIVLSNNQKSHASTFVCLRYTPL
ncbi:Rab-3-interacting molecule unc-10 [Trichinella pseudospiralis]|uniref:Rab-3-interacting molecule unc-10 n=1 Tax=Trichinella pseudospiralis TaxID=6337 RepID=A0A0V1JCA9_TRIPS|nr:Rab-3-interacting molecule unc-10 [Trichinella pseudospiralis]